MSLDRVQTRVGGGGGKLGGGWRGQVSLVRGPYVFFLGGGGGRWARLDGRKV